MRNFPPVYQPDHSLLCGACCVAASLFALERLPLSRPVTARRYSGVTGDFTGEEVRFLPSDDLERLISKIYSVTGIIPPHRTDGYDPAVPGLNSIVAMAWVLRRFGLPSEILFRDSAAFRGLRDKYPQEFRLNGKRGIPVAFPGSGAFPGKGEIFLLSLRRSPSMGHSIAVNSSGEVYDPAGGEGGLPAPRTVRAARANTPFDGRGYGGEWQGVGIRVAAAREDLQRV